MMFVPTSIILAYCSMLTFRKCQCKLLYRIVVAENYAHITKSFFASTIISSPVDLSIRLWDVTSFVKSRVLLPLPKSFIKFIVEHQITFRPT